MPNKMDVNQLAQALAYVLVQAVDQGSKEGGWDGVFQREIPRFGRGYKDISGVPNAHYAHGSGGLFSTPGIEKDVISAHMTPRDVDGLLPVYPTVYMNPIFPSLTGFKEDDGEEPDGVCDDCLGGEIQGCNLTATFGHLCRGSSEIHITRTVQMLNRGEVTPLTLIGDMLGPGSISRMPNTPGEWLEVVTRAEMMKIAVFLQRKVIKMTWRGNPVNNKAGGGYKEFPGLELLVGTGKVDLQTQVACPSLDSLVMNFGFNAVDDNDPDIVNYLCSLEWYMYSNAERMGMLPVDWIICMPPGLWLELSAVWPCRYRTNKCTSALQPTTNIVVMNNEEAVRARDEMRRSMTIEINGRVYPVITCDGMTELNGLPGNVHLDQHLLPGEYSGDIFFLPLSVRGQMKVLYWEHLDYTKAESDITFTRSSNDFWTDGGRFLWTVERKRGCYKMNAEMDMRLVLRTPHLAARIDNIKFTPLLHLRQPFQEDPYFLKGGVATREDPTLKWYTEWHTPS